MPSLLDNALTARTKYGLLVITGLVALYLARNFVTGSMIGGFFGSYLLPFILWGLLALAIFYLLPKARSATRPRHRPMLNWAAFLSAMALIVAVYAVGLLEGYGRNPNEHSFLGAIIYIFYLGSMLVGMELSRAWLINFLFKKKPNLGIAFTGFMFTFFAFLPGRLASFETALEGAEFAGNIFLPALAENLLASMLAFLGGAVPAIIYRGTLLAYQWFAPVLPDLNWVIFALVGTFVPVFCMVMVYQLYQSEVLRVRSREKESPFGWIATSVISVVMIWFAVGVFNIFPNVIISGSMLPKIDIGDIVIVQKVEPNQIKVGDVILFREIEQKTRINHRVIEIRKDERGLPLFITKGDANQNPDSDPVIAEQLKGKVVYVVPKVGWITIMLRSPG
jgi:signal peptidase I